MGLHDGLPSAGSGKVRPLSCLKSCTCGGSLSSSFVKTWVELSDPNGGRDQSIYEASSERWGLSRSLTSCSRATLTTILQAGAPGLFLGTQERAGHDMAAVCHLRACQCVSVTTCDLEQQQLRLRLSSCFQHDSSTLTLRAPLASPKTAGSTVQFSGTLRSLHVP